MKLTIESNHADRALEAVSIVDRKKAGFLTDCCPIAQALFDNGATNICVCMKYIYLDGQQFLVDEAGERFIKQFNAIVYDELGNNYESLGLPLEIELTLEKTTWSR